MDKNKHVSGQIKSGKKKTTYRALIIALTTFIFLHQPLSVNAQIVDKNSIIAEDAELEMLGDGFSFTEGSVPDDDGNVYFTDQPNNNIVKWNHSTGEKIAHIPVDKGWTANICFAGPDRDMLFITAMDSVFGIKMNARGVE